MPQHSRSRHLLAALCMFACVTLTATTCGCVSTHNRLNHLCRCVRFCCDDYCEKCDTAVCTPPRRQCCDDYCRKCPTPECVPCYRPACDNYCEKPLPGVCCCK